MSTQLSSENPTTNSSNLPTEEKSPLSVRWKLGLIGLFVIAVLGSAATLMQGAISKQEAKTRQTYAVQRGELLVTVTEQGTLESSKNTEIKCQVRGGYGGRGGNSTVTWVIPPGSVVKKDDVLVRLDTKIIEETVSLGKTDTNNAVAALARAKADLATAEIAIDAYKEGRFRSRMKAMEKQRKIAEWNLATAKEMLANAEKLFTQGYVNELEVQSIGYTVKQAELELNVVDTEIDVYSRLTNAMELETLNGQLTAARARLEGRKAGVELEQGRLDLAKVEFGRCTIKAPSDGLVIYPSTAKWKDTPDVAEGASVHNNQVLLLMPDLTEMQVKVGIHESIVDRVKAGLPVRITLPNQTLDTEVALVAEVASPAGWWSGNSVLYDATIDLPPEPGLKPGMTAEVEITIARHENVLTVPVEAIVETNEEGNDKRRFCWVQQGANTERRELSLGDSNDKFIIAKAGLDPGEIVVLNPLESIADAQQLVEPSWTHTIQRGNLTVSLTEQGTLESSNNTVIKSRVRGASTVNWVIENGTQVQPGDVVVRLENKEIEDYLHERTKFAHLSRDAAIGFRADATRAGIAINEYLEGRFRTQLMTLEKDLAIGQERLNTAKAMLNHAKTMADRGYVSELDVEQKQFAVKEATLEVDRIGTEIDVLKQFSKEEELETLRGNWEAAKAAANGHEEVLRMDLQRMELAKSEIERCVIRAERAGLVIYPKSEEWKDTPYVAEGATVHFDQELLLMPDLTQMQVKVGIHETMLEHIRPGLRAHVTLPDRELEGEVVSVASAARPAGWWSGNLVKYDAVIQLPSVEGLKPGMSAEVEIVMKTHDDVLLAPLAAISENEDGTYCGVRTDSGIVRRDVTLGDNNDRFAVVKSGLKLDDQVVLDPSAVE